MYIFLFEEKVLFSVVLNRRAEASENDFLFGMAPFSFSFIIFNFFQKYFFVVDINFILPE